MTKILHIDDDERILTMVRHFLEQHGFQIVTSTQPFIAPLIVREKPDLLLVDINMPLLSGEKLVKVLKKNELFSGLHILFFSSQSPAELQKTVELTGAAGFVTKDQGLVNLLRKIRQVLSQSETGPEAPAR